MEHQIKQRQVTQERIKEIFDRYLLILNGIEKDKIALNREYLEGIYHTLNSELENLSNENYQKGLEIENKIRELLGGSLNSIKSKNSENKFYAPKPVGSWENYGIERVL